MQSKFNIGDKVWYADAKQTEKFITCPHCLGSTQLICILGSGEQVGFDCTCCDQKALLPSGKVKVYEFDAVADLVTITGIEMTNNKIVYRSGSDCCYLTYKEEEVFSTKEEALAKAEVKKAEHEVEEAKRFANRKDKANKDWANNVTYHRECIKRLERDLDYHRRKLAIAENKAKLYA